MPSVVYLLPKIKDIQHSCYGMKQHNAIVIVTSEFKQTERRMAH